MASEQRRHVRLAIGLRSTAQSLSLIGNAVSAFVDHGVDLEIARIETAGPAGIAGLMRGDWEFAEFGAVPVVQSAMEGQDPVILMAAEPVAALYILAAKDIAQSTDLAGGEIGVLTVAGQTGYSAKEMLRRWNLSGEVGLVELMRYPEILDRLLQGTIRGGVLTADYRFAAEPEAGISVLADLGAEFRFQGPVLATTWQYLRQHRDIVERVVAGYCQAIQVFKMRSDIVWPVLEKHLPFADAAGVRRIHEFYVERFSRIPRPSVSGLQAVIDSCQSNSPGQRKLTVENVYDPSVLDALERQGLFNSLYQAA